MEAARLWLQVLNLVGTAAVGAWMYLEKRSDKTNERINDLASRHEELDKTLREVKTTAAMGITHDNLGKVYERLNGMDRKLSEISGEFRAHHQSLQLLMNKITEKGLK